MPKYRVIGIVDAYVAVGVIEAPDAEAAESFAEDNINAPTLCYSCDGLLEVGDITRFELEQEDDETPADYIIES